MFASLPSLGRRVAACQSVRLLGGPGIGLLLLGQVHGQALSVVGVSPGRNALFAPRPALVTATFDQPLSGTPATLGALRVFSQQAGGKKAGTASIAGNTLRFAPARLFKPGETVFVTLVAGVQGTNATLTTPQVFQFTTATEPAAGTFSGGYNQKLFGPGAPFALGDVDGDGDLDLVVSNSGRGDAVVQRNNGTGTFSSAGEVFPVALYGQSLLLADVDNDGDLDLLVAGGGSLTGSGSLSISRNDGQGRFGPRQELAQDFTQAIVTGDIDGDGDVDIVSCFGPGTGRLGLARNDGAGNFSNSFYTIGGTVGSVALGDVDGDGDLDLLTARGPGNTVNVSLNNGQGSFSTSQEVAVAAGSFRVLLGDVDGDGDLDLLAAGGSGGGTPTVSVRRNNGQGSFGGTEQVALSSSPFTLALGDVDGDGDLDLLALAGASRVVDVRLNNGLGTFGGTQAVPIGNSPAGLALGDVDEDGDLDLLTTRGGDTLCVRFNQPRPLATAPGGLARQISLYPNPARTTTRLLLPAMLPHSPLAVSILNVLGQVVLEQQLTPAAPELHLQTLRPGLYHVRLHTPAGLVTKPLLIE